MNNRIWYRAALVGACAGLMAMSLSACTDDAVSGIVMQPVSGPALELSENFTFRAITDVDKSGRTDYGKKLTGLGYTFIDSKEGLKEYCVENVLSLKDGSKGECYIFTDKGLFDYIDTGLFEAAREAEEIGSPKLVYAEDSYLYNELALDYSHFYSNGISLFKLRKIQDIETKNESYSVYAIYYLSFQTEYECRMVNEMIEQICGDFTGSIGDKAYQAYEYLRKNVKYSVSDSDRSLFCAYGALSNGYAICEGFAKTYKLMMDSLGIDNEIVRSDNHAWNVIKIDGEWYAVDVTNGSYNDCDVYFMMDQSIMYSKKGVTVDGYHLTKEHIASYGYIDGTNTGTVSLKK